MRSIQGSKMNPWNARWECPWAVEGLSRRWARYGVRLGSMRVGICTDCCQQDWKSWKSDELGES